MADETIALSIAAAAEARALFTFALPNLADLQHDPKTFDLATIRQGERTGALLALSIGGVIAVWAKDPLPEVMTAMVVIGMVAAYEHAIRNPGTPARNDG